MGQNPYKTLEIWQVLALWIIPFVALVGGFNTYITKWE
ncbi:hypothetical protein SDC9_95642 [bioreactor metagenome]|jgi:hypothetical protein|uniref:Uncharacterized protein n=1 Tax=bioreactor metagenome TaxID=1076179 RepID=A0A645A6V6_9ZZZZ|nr:hypothetical protein [Clostridiales bacterium]